MKIKLGTDTYISKLSDIETSTLGSQITIGSGTHVDAFVKFKAAGGRGDIIIGNSCYINSGCVLYMGNGINIGDNVLIASNCTLAPTNHKYQCPSQPINTQGFATSKGGIYIGNDVWIGANTVVLDGAIIPDGCVIGAASLVSQKLQPYNIYAGNPLKQIGTRN